ncbi:MAG: glycosyltransferase, partial [Gemmatimonadaceae bacterium]|nr:glycosyltransferase [Gemmatimonadaceae bacterium]
ASTPRVVTMHGSDVRLAQRLRPAQRLMRAVLADCAARTAVSSWLANAVRTIAPQLQVDVAPMPVDTARFVPPTNDAARAGVLFVGRLNAQKGTADLIDALGHPALREASLVVVGDGPDRAALEQRAIDNGSAPRITWRGTLTPTELVALYQGARVVAMPSRDEGLGLVAVEAQLCGTPVVAYASGGLTDVVRTNAGGALVAAGDTEALARALAAVVHDPAEGARRGQLARAQVLSRFSPAAVASAYRAVYERVQAPPRAGT